MTVILVNTEDVTDTIEEEREAWVERVLVALGADQNRIKDIDSREYLMSLNLEVWNNISNGCVDIHRDSKIVAQWKEPKLIKKKEDKNKYYYEIHLNEWALPFQMRRK